MAVAESHRPVDLRSAMEFNLAQFSRAVRPPTPTRLHRVWATGVHLRPDRERARRFARALNSLGVRRAAGTPAVGANESGQSHLGLYMANSTSSSRPCSARTRPGLPRSTSTTATSPTSWCICWSGRRLHLRQPLPQVEFCTEPPRPDAPPSLSPVRAATPRGVPY